MKDKMGSLVWIALFVAVYHFGVLSFIGTLIFSLLLTIVIGTLLLGWPGFWEFLFFIVIIPILLSILYNVLFHFFPRI